MFNFARQAKGGGIAGRWIQGTVVKNDDSKEEKGKRSLRCRIRCEFFHDGVEDDDLPWMGPDSNTQGTASGGTVGAVKVPPVGTKVWCKFSDNTLYHGTYGGAVNNQNASPDEFTGKNEDSGGGGDSTKATADDDGELDQESIDDYPNVVGNVDPSGHKTVVNNKRDTIDIEHVTGSKLNVDGEGNAVLTINNKTGINPDAKKKYDPGMGMVVVKDLKILVQGKMMFGSKGDMSFITEGDMLFGAKGNISIGAKGELYLDGSNIFENTKGANVPSLPQVSTPKSRKRPVIADPSKKSGS